MSTPFALVKVVPFNLYVLACVQAAHLRQHSLTLQVFVVISHDAILHA